MLFCYFVQCTVLTLFVLQYSRFLASYSRVDIALRMCDVFYTFNLQQLIALLITFYLFGFTFFHNNINTLYHVHNFLD